MRTKRDIVSHLPYSEFPAATGTFTGLAISLLLGLFGAVNTYASSINITLTGNANLNLVKSNSEPVFGTTASNPQTATITSDHFTGYTLTIAGLDDVGSLKGANDNTKTIPSIQTAISESTFRNDTQYNDMWGFLPNKLHVSGSTITNENYQPAPKLAGTTIDVTTSPTSNEGNKYELALGAKITPTMALDSYSGTFVLAATGNGYNYHIGYTDDNNTIPADQYDTGAETGSINLSSQTPTKSGYVFVGWCDTETTNDGTVCPGKTYSAGERIDLVASSANNMLLHAIWSRYAFQTFDAAFAAAGKNKSGDYYQMQDMNSGICNSIAIGTDGTLIDTRNSKTYTVYKYADGHCWMRENLNLVLTKDGNVDAYNFETKEIISYIPDNSTQTSAGIVWNQDASDGARSFAQNENKFIGGTDIATAGTIMDTGQPYEHIGILYNWAAATAQTGDQAKSAGASGEQVIPTSICPKGWRLPVNEGDYSFSTLMGSYGLPTTDQDQGYSGQLQNPLNFNRPGNYGWNNGAMNYRGTVGYFWSSVGVSATNAHFLTFYFTHFYPQSGNNKGLGFSVRCVAV